MKKLLSLLLVLAMMLTLVSGMALASEEAPEEAASAEETAAPAEEIAEETAPAEQAAAPEEGTPVVTDGESEPGGTCGDDAAWRLDTESGILTISGTGAMKDYPLKSGEPTAPWYAMRNYITAVVIEDGITSVGTLAFYNCDSIASVTLGKDVTSIGAAAFALCSSLQELTVPYTVTSIDSQAFAFDSGLVLICARGTAAHSYAMNNNYEVTWRIVDCDHDYIGSVTTEPTCIETGIKTYVCSMCRDTYTEEVPVSDEHVWDDGTVTKDPTCTEKGEALYTCTVCKKTETRPVDMIDHSWDDGVETAPATATEEGEMLYTCTVCKATKTEVIPKAPYEGTGWVEGSAGWYYFKDGEMVKSDWVKYNGSWYYLQEDGVMACSGRTTIDGTVYSFAESGKMQTGWVKEVWGSYSYTTDVWFYFSKSGAQYYGWLKYNGYWYYLQPNNAGIMEQGNFLVIENDDGSETDYFFDANGRMQTGWVENKFEYDDITYDMWFYFSKSGAQYFGWLKYNGSWYYLDPDMAGIMAASCVKEITASDGSSALYAFAASGKMATGWITLAGSWFYARANGSLYTESWLKYGGYWYYLDENGVMVTGDYTFEDPGYDVDIYHFDKNGRYLGKT